MKNVITSWYGKEVSCEVHFPPFDDDEYFINVFVRLSVEGVAFSGWGEAGTEVTATMLALAAMEKQINSSSSKEYFLEKEKMLTEEYEMSLKCLKSRHEVAAGLVKNIQEVLNKRNIRWAALVKAFSTENKE